MNNAALMKRLIDPAIVPLLFLVIFMIPIAKKIPKTYFKRIKE